MRRFVYLAVIAVFLAFDWSAGAAVAARKKAPAKKSSAAQKKRSTHASTSHKGTTAAHKTASASANSSASRKRTTASRKKTSSKRRSATTWRNRQTAPTPDRYKEIQDALVSRGFLDGQSATGSWGSSSVDALKRFQASQNIDANGKINSLSLIALGLGPKREAAAKPAAAPAAPEQHPDASHDR
jgi:hypothetical protein